MKAKILFVLIICCLFNKQIYSQGYSLTSSLQINKSSSATIWSSENQIFDCDMPNIDIRINANGTLVALNNQKIHFRLYEGTTLILDFLSDPITVSPFFFSFPEWNIDLKESATFTLFADLVASNGSSLIISTVDDIQYDFPDFNTNEIQLENFSETISINGSTYYQYCESREVQANFNLINCADKYRFVIEKLDQNGQSFIPNQFVYSNQNFASIPQNGIIDINSLFSFSPGNYKVSAIIQQKGTEFIAIETFKIRFDNRIQIGNLLDCYVTCQGEPININLTSQNNSPLNWSSNSTNGMNRITSNGSNSFTFLHNGTFSSNTDYMIEGSATCELGYTSVKSMQIPPLDLSSNSTEICSEETSIPINLIANTEWSTSYPIWSGSSVTSGGVFNPQSTGIFNLTCSASHTFFVQDCNISKTCTNSQNIEITYVKQPEVIIEVENECGTQSNNGSASFELPSSPLYNVVWKDYSGNTLGNASSTTLNGVTTYSVANLSPNLQNQSYSMELTGVGSPQGLCTLIVEFDIQPSHSITPIGNQSTDCEYTSSINQFESVNIGIVNPYSGSVPSDYTMTMTSTTPTFNNFSVQMSSLPQTVSSLKGEFGATNNYTVSVAHTNGCVATETFTVGADRYIDVSVDIDNATCNGKSNGSVDLDIVSNVLSNSYDISFISGGGSYQNITAVNDPTNTFSTAAFTKNTAKKTFSTVIIEDGTCNYYTPSISVENTYNDLSTFYGLQVDELTGAECYGVANGTLEATATNGSGAYGPWDFAWSNGVTENNVYSSTQNGFLAGSHAVTITDKPGSGNTELDGCKLTKTGTLNNLGSNKWQEHTNPSQAGYESHVTSMAIDAQENVYVAGIFTNDLTIQGQTATNNTLPGNEFFIASFDVCGALRWLDYSDSENYTFEDIQITEHDGTVYLANLPSVGPGSPIVVLDGSGNPVSNSFQLAMDVFGLQEIEASSGSVLQTTVFPAFVLFNADEVLDIEKNQDNLFIAGQFSGKAAVYHVDVSNLTLNNIWEDQYTTNVFTDLELDANGNMYVSGTANGDIDVDGAGTYTPTGTSDAFIAYRDNTGSVFGFTTIDASIDGEATGLELVGTNQIALVGNYTGEINGYGSGSIASYDNEMGFIANIVQSSSLSFNWLKTLEGPTTTPVTCTSLNQALCTDVSVNTNGDVFVYGTFDGSSMHFTEFNQNVSTAGEPELQNIWNGKLGGFNTSGFSVDWLSSMSSTSVIPIDMVSGSSNNYIAGDFEENMTVGSNTILNTSGPSIVSSYFVRFGDAIDPNQGAYYKTDGSETALDAEFLQLYPNPSTGKINIEWEANDVIFNMNVTDVTGRLIFSQSGLNGKEAYASIDVSTFDAGTYFLSFESELGTVVKPFIKH